MLVSGTHESVAESARRIGDEDRNRLNSCCDLSHVVISRHCCTRRDAEVSIQLKFAKDER
jgi:hypothetical protein